MTSDLISISWPVSTLAAEIIGNWPKGFFRLLDQLKSAADTSNGGSLQRTFQGFYHALYSVFKGPEFIWLRQAFEDYVAEHWHGSIGRRNRRLYDRVINKMEWVPAAVAAQQLGISVAAIQKISSQGQIDVRRYETSSGRSFSKVSRTSLNNLAATGSLAAVTLLDAAKSLGFKRQRLLSLLPLICPNAFKLEPTNVWMIPESWLAEIFSIIQQLPALQSAPNNQWVTLDWLFRYEAPNEAAMGALINALRHRTLQGVRYKDSARLSQIHLVRSEVQAIWSNMVSTPTKHLSLMEVATRLHIKQEVAYAITRSGLLEARLMKVGRRQSLWVSPAALERFSNNFVFARDLAAQLQTSSLAITKTLKNLDVSPVAGPGIDSCRQLVFRASDIQKSGISCLQEQSLPT